MQTNLRKLGRLTVLIGLTAAACTGGVIKPDDFGGPYCLSPAFGPAACAIGAQYANGGLLFSQMGVGTAVFSDPPNAWGGINAFGQVDLLAPVNAAIVVPGTTIPGTTNYVAVEAGYASPGALQLNVYGVGGNLLATRVSGLDGTGPAGRHLIVLSVPGIRFLSVWTPANDSFGVNQIELGEISRTSVIPEPGTVALAGAGLLVLILRARRRK